MLLKKYFHSGETLIEVVVAVSILLIVIAPTSAFVINGLRSSQLNRHQLIGLSLTEEGIEALRIIRDTNLLRLSENPQNCWNVKQSINNPTVCDIKENKIAPGAYRVVRNTETLTWELELQSNALDLKTCPTDQKCIPYLLKLDPNTHLYTHGVGEDTPYHRSITIVYLDSNYSPIPLNMEYKDSKSMLVTSRIEFQVGTSFSKILLRQLLPQ